MFSPLYVVLFPFFLAHAESVSALRAVALTPALAEIAGDLCGTPVACPTFVGAVEFADEPVWVREIPRIGSYDGLSFEKLLSLRPTHVLASRDGNARLEVERIERTGIKVETYDSKTLGGIEATAASLARLFQVGSRWSEAQQDWERAKEELRKLRAERTGRRTGVTRVALVVGIEPWTLIAGGSFITDGLREAGVENVFASSNRSYVTVETEQIVAAKPDMIWIALGQGVGGIGERAVKQARDRLARFHLRTEAVEDPRVLRPTLRFPRALAALVRSLPSDDGAYDGADVQADDRGLR